MLNCRASVGKKGRKGSSYNTSMPSRIKKEMEKYAYNNGTQVAINRFKSKYQQYTFLRISIDVRSITRKKICYHRPNFNKRGRI